MRTTKSILTLTLAGLFAAASAGALAQSPAAPGGGWGQGPRGQAPLDPAQQAERVQARLNALKDALKLQAGQLDAWNAYEAKVKSEAQAHAQMRKGMLDLRGDAQAMADYRVTMMKHNAQSAEEINGLRKTLVATLSPEQKATFDQFAPGPGMGRGPGYGRGYGPGGPGFGPGPGGRGAGYGRGCLGAA